MINNNNLGKKLSRKEMKQVKGGTSDYGNTVWRCLYTLSGKIGTIYHECSATDPSGPNYYCTNTEKSC
jgi:hypothetical protein